MGDVHAGHAPEGLIDPTDSWGTLGAHVVAAKGARGARVGRGVTVVSLVLVNTAPWGKQKTHNATRAVTAPKWPTRAMRTLSRHAVSSLFTSHFLLPEVFIRDHGVRRIDAHVSVYLPFIRY